MSVGSPGDAPRLSVRNFPWSLVVLLAAIVAAWIVGRLVWTLLKLAGVLALVAGTYFLLRPDLKGLLGRGDTRPWLARMREHPWRDVPTPFGWKAPRALAYCVAAACWWWVLR